LRILLVDDDPALRTLLKTTFEVADVAVDEAESAVVARRRIRSSRPDVIVLDINMPGTSGLELCAELKAASDTRDIPIVLLTGSDGGTDTAAQKAGANAFVRKPFSPLELLAVAERLTGGLAGVPFLVAKKRTHGPDEELLLYARDLRHLLEVERGQRELLQSAYQQTVSALASALESKDTGTRAHSQRVQSYATALAEAVGEEGVVRDESAPTGSSFMTSARSGSRTGSSRSRGRSAPRSGARWRRTPSLVRRCCRVSSS
jgi:CheY-like chemotaxis protein